MRVSYKWLKNYVQVDETPERLAVMLTDAGVAVDAIVPLNAGLIGAVTGKLLSVEAHPNANKLLICAVDVGSEVLTIVTGANNVKAGQVVPVGVVGTKLPDGTILGVADFRGVKSYGMLLSADEMGLEKKTIPTHQRDGIYIFPDSTPIGRDVIEIMGLDDCYFELDLTPNRADCLSMLGVAWDVSALTKSKLNLPVVKELPEPALTHPDLKITIKDRTLCPGYIGLIVEDIEVKDSPQWLQNALRAVGLRPINNIVDITNYVMWELGQPLHAFDYDKLTGQEIIVRQSIQGESIVTLDGEERTLPEGTIVIADAARPVAIAGIMGGINSEVTPSTTKIVLESAQFNLVSIRRSSRQIGLRSDASARFDKGIDPAGVETAVKRVAQLIEELGCGKVIKQPIGIKPKYAPTTNITLRPEKVNGLLGTSLSVTEMQTILTRLGFSVAFEQGNMMVEVPSRRRDVVNEVDLVEEVGRVHGLEHIPTLPMTGDLTQGSLTPKQRLVRSLRHVLIGMGLNEILTLSFYDPSFKDTLRLAIDHPWSKAIMLQNPLSRERSALRPSLIPGMIEVLTHNISRQILGMAAFEIGNVFEAKEQPIAQQPYEHLRLSLGAYGVISGNWNKQPVKLDFFYLKGIIEALLPQANFVPSSHLFLHPGRQADILIAGTTVGFLGELHPLVGLRERTIVAELDILSAFSMDFALPHYVGMKRSLSVERDMAFVVKADIPASDIIKCIEQSGGELLQAVTLFDVYSGTNLPKGMISLAFRMEFAKAVGTLTEAELSDVLSAIRSSVEQTFAAQLRS